MRPLMIFAALAFLAAAPAAKAQFFDATGRCHDANGTLTKMRTCTGPQFQIVRGYKLDAKGQCHGPDGKVVKIQLCKH